MKWCGCCTGNNWWVLTLSIKAPRAVCGETHTYGSEVAVGGRPHSDHNTGAHTSGGTCGLIRNNAQNLTSF